MEDAIGQFSISRSEAGKTVWESLKTNFLFLPLVRGEGVWISSVSAKIDKEFLPSETLLSPVLRDKTHFLKSGRALQ